MPYCGIPKNEDITFLAHEDLILSRENAKALLKTKKIGDANSNETEELDGDNLEFKTIIFKFNFQPGS